MKKLLTILGAMLAVLAVLALTVGPGQAFAESRDRNTRTTTSSEYQGDHSTRYSRNKQTRESDDGRYSDDDVTSPTPSPTPTYPRYGEDDDERDVTSPSPSPTPTPSPTPGPTPSPTPSPTPTLVSYSATIQPILNKECNSCHPTAGINLSSYTGTKAAVNYLPGMGSSHLTASELQSLMDWINQGALNN